MSACLKSISLPILPICQHDRLLHRRRLLNFNLQKSAVVCPRNQPIFSNICLNSVAHFAFMPACHQVWACLLSSALHKHTCDEAGGWGAGMHAEFTKSLPWFDFKDLMQMDRFSLWSDLRQQQRVPNRKKEGERRQKNILKRKSDICVANDRLRRSHRQHVWHSLVNKYWQFV